MLAILKTRLPANEATVRASLEKYKSELEAHRKTVGVPAPWPDYEILRDIVANGGDFVVVESEEVTESLPSTLEEWKAHGVSRINRERENALDAGIAYGGNVFDSDERSRTNLTGVVAAVQAGIPLPDGFTWRSANNRDVPMTAVELVGLAAVMVSHVNAQYVKSWELKARIAAAANADDVVAITWDAGS